MSFSIKDFLSIADLVTFTEEILNGNFIFCAVRSLFTTVRGSEIINVVKIPAMEIRRFIIYVQQ